MLNLKYKTKYLSYRVGVYYFKALTLYFGKHTCIYLIIFSISNCIYLNKKLYINNAI